MQGPPAPTQAGPTVTLAKVWPLWSENLWEMVICLLWRPGQAEPPGPSILVYGNSQEKCLETCNWGKARPETDPEPQSGGTMLPALATYYFDLKTILWASPPLCIAGRYMCVGSCLTENDLCAILRGVAPTIDPGGIPTQMAEGVQDALPHYDTAKVQALEVRFRCYSPQGWPSPPAAPRVS